MERSVVVRRAVRIAVGVALVAGIVALVLSDAHASLTATAIRQWLLDSGPWGPALFVLAFAVLQPVGLSAHVFILAGAMVWPPWIAAGLSWLGTIAAGGTSFWFARYMGREWVQRRLPERIRGYDERLAVHGFRTVLVLRLLLFTFAPMQLMLGVSKVRFGPYIAATALGVLPTVVIETMVGGAVIDWVFS